ncbi:uncharacterized protein PV09_05243 [Verruconis gallopava]|uniref:F-box domain-containing protein n=1 Tax=Verruconis gallopava TaxID=253628 RepID=A0A0D1XM40_9PEZI|nr:uncharacterized protein PV09_05243 [Verruconis gallopava]KIW03476.1 hypothetical protein PV09_05243 [Verruconis gallopava]
MGITILNLPTEVTEHIASYLSRSDLYSLRLAHPRHLPELTLDRLRQVHQWNAAPFSLQLISSYKKWDAAPALRRVPKRHIQVSDEQDQSLWRKLRCTADSPKNGRDLYCFCVPCVARREYVKDITDYTVTYYCLVRGFGTTIHPMRRRSWDRALKDLSVHPVFSPWITSVCVCPRPLWHSNIKTGSLGIDHLGLGEAICRFPSLETLWMYEGVRDEHEAANSYEVRSVIAEMVKTSTPGPALKNLIIAEVRVSHEILAAVIRKYESTLRHVCLDGLALDDDYFTRTVLRALIPCRLAYLKLFGLRARESSVVPGNEEEVQGAERDMGIILRHPSTESLPFEVRYFRNNLWENPYMVQQSIVVNGEDVWQSSRGWLCGLKECRSYHDSKSLVSRADSAVEGHVVKFKDASESFETESVVKYKSGANNGLRELPQSGWIRI